VGYLPDTGSSLFGMVTLLSVSYMTTRAGCWTHQHFTYMKNLITRISNRFDQSAEVKQKISELARMVARKVTVNYYLRNIAEKDPDTGRILTGYGRKALEQAIIQGRVKTDEQGRIYLNTLKNL
jgi:hypothetical protein